jgi:hypothetical protein
MRTQYDDQGNLVDGNAVVPLNGTIILTGFVFIVFMIGNICYQIRLSVQ